MIRSHFNFIFLFISLFYKSFSIPIPTGFTIDIEGQNVVTTKITDQTEFYAIAITELGTLIKYKSDSSILSTQKLQDLSPGYTKSFICQYKTNKVALTRDNKVYEITFDSNGEASLTQKPDSSSIITYLHCNKNKNMYIYTYLSAENKYHFKLSDNTIFNSNSLDDSIQSSSCFLLDSFFSQILCINIIASQKKLNYYYHSSGATSPSDSNPIEFNDIHELKDSLIKFYSISEILLCLSAKQSKTSDIYFYCYMLNFISDSLSISNRISALKKINEDTEYCQIEKLGNSYLYSIICLSYYYRSTYLLSLIQFTPESIFVFYPSTDFENIHFSLLKNS